MDKTFIGVDIGKKGGIAIQSPLSTVLVTIPLINNEVDYHALYKILSEFKDKPCHVVFENLRAIFGSAAGATFTFGHVAGATEMAVIACGLPYTKVNAKDWQKELFQGVQEISKPSKSKKTMIKDTKAMALLSAKRLFPDLDLRGSEKSKNAHEGIVDALLMSEYARRKFS